MAQQDLVSSRAALRSEQEAHKHKERETRQQTQQRVQELDLAYFRVEAELRMKTTEAKKHFGAVKELEEVSGLAATVYHCHEPSVCHKLLRTGLLQQLHPLIRLHTVMLLCSLLCSLLGSLLCPQL